MIGFPKFDAAKLLASAGPLGDVARLARTGRVKDVMSALLRETRTHGPVEKDAKRAPSTYDGRSGDLVGDLFDRFARSTSPASESGPRSRAPNPAPGARFESHAYVNAAGALSFKLYVPAKAPSGPRPLVVMLHGCTQSPDDFAAGTRMNDVAEEMGFLVAYPAQPASANTHKCWNWFNTKDQERNSGEPSLIAGITRTIAEDHDVDPARIYVAGLSAGGAAAAIMAAEYPDLYAAVGIHSGLACGVARDLPSALAAMKSGRARPNGARLRIPTIVFHGDRDATVHPANADGIIAQAAPRGAVTAQSESSVSSNGAAYTRTLRTTVDGAQTTEQWIVHGAAHAWSGGNRAGSYTDPRGPDASREMARFFLEHPKRT
jgi:poly(hydroxyalkanoate) depolymerase family esterase